MIRDFNKHSLKEFMIARKIIYEGIFDDRTLNAVYELVRKIEITGNLKKNSAGHLELNLEGDLSMIKLIEHQIERKCPTHIKGKEILPAQIMNYPNFSYQH